MSERFCTLDCVESLDPMLILRLRKDGSLLVSTTSRNRRRQTSLRRIDALWNEALGENSVGTERTEPVRFLGSLGSHNLSFVGETLGNPNSIAGLSVDHLFHTAIFDCRNKSRELFIYTQEASIGSPIFDSHLAINGEYNRLPSRKILLTSKVCGSR